MALAACAIVALLFLSAVITTAEVSAFQLGPSRLRTLEEEGFRGAEELSEIRTLEGRVRTSVRLTTRILNLSALGIAAGTHVTTWGAGGPLSSVLVGVLLILLAADLLPRFVAAGQPVRLALTLAPLLLLLTRRTRLLAAPFERVEDRFNGSGPDRSTQDSRALREIQAIGTSEGVLESTENLLVERAFRLDELTAWDVMVPRVDIFAWNEALTLAEVVHGLGDVRYNRVPVYRESIDDVTGIIYVREAYERYVRGEGDTPLRELAKEPFFVPGSLSLTQLLRDFQARRIHMGIVADEFGGTDGLVTLEDVLEELVGEIHDEKDFAEVEEEVVRLSESVVESDGSADLRLLNELLDTPLPEVEHRSLNGFILEELGHVPEVGDRFDHGGLRIEILEASETQVLRARLIRLPDDALAEAPNGPQSSSSAGS